MEYVKVYRSKVHQEFTFHNFNVFIHTMLFLKPIPLTFMACKHIRFKIYHIWYIYINRLIHKITIDIPAIQWRPIVVTSYEKLFT